jgi:hypothetical protein
MVDKSRPPAPSESAPSPAVPAVTLSSEMFAELMGLVRGRAESEPSPVTERMLTALEGLAKGNQRLGEEFARTVRRSNAQSPGLSVFTYDKRCEHCRTKTPHPALDADGQVVPGATGPLAHPKPRLIHKVLVCGGPQQEDALTPLEIELFNQFTKSVTAHNGNWVAMLRRDGTTSVLTIDFPAKTLDHLQDLPRTMAELLAELLYGEEATDAMDLVGEVMRLKKRLAELETVTVTTKAPEPAAVGESA